MWYVSAKLKWNTSNASQCTAEEGQKQVEPSKQYTQCTPLGSDTSRDRRLGNESHDLPTHTKVCRLLNDAQTGMLPGYPESAICVQRFDDSLNSAIHTTYRNWLRSSSMHEPRAQYHVRDCHPLRCAVPSNLSTAHSPWKRFSRLQFAVASNRDFKFELVPLHSPLLRESLLVSFPPLINMLKFSG